MKQTKTMNAKFYRHLTFASVGLVAGLAAWVGLITYTVKTPHWNGQQGYLSALSMAPLYLLIFTVICLSLLWLVVNLTRAATEKTTWAQRKVNRNYIGLLVLIGLVLLFIALKSAVIYIKNYNNLIRP